MSADAIGICVAVWIGGYLALHFLLSELRKGAVQRQAILEAMERIASQQGRTDMRIELIVASLRGKAKPGL